MILSRTRLAALALLAICASAPAQLELIDRPAGKAQGRVVGDVRWVLDGKCTGTNFLQVPRDAFLYALGGGALEPNPLRQGEGIVVNGRLFIKSLDPSCGYCTRTAPEGQSESGWGSFLAGVDSQAKPTARYRIPQGTSETVESVYTQLAKQHGKLFGVAGLGHFTSLEVSAIRKAPSFGEPILGPKRSEYFHPKATLTNVDAMFFGLVLRSAGEATTATQTVFYINPDDKAAAGPQSHSHFCTLETTAGVDLTKPETALGKVRDVAHILTQSRLTSGEFAVYELQDLTPVGSLPNP